MAQEASKEAKEVKSAKKATPGPQPTFRVGKREKMKFPRWDVPKDLVERLGLFHAFYVEATGEEVTIDEVVTALLDRALDREPGLKKWLDAGGAKRVKTTEVRDGAEGAAPVEVQASPAAKGEPPAKQAEGGKVAGSKN